MKKGDLSIQYMFMLFIGVIAVFVIIGMLGKWAFSSQNMMCKISGDCDSGGGITDKQTILVASGDQMRNEIIKHAKLCYAKQRAAEDSGDLCYTVKCTGSLTDCHLTGTDCTDMYKALGQDANLNYKARQDTDLCDSPRKAIISYDYGAQQVVIR